jgi:seryl-tRNA synthetase
MNRRYLRDNFDVVKAALIRRGEDCESLDYILSLDKECRRRTEKLDRMKNERNKFSDKIAKQKLSRDNNGADDIIKNMRALGEDIRDCESEVKKLNCNIENLLINIPNVPDSSVPDGKTDKDNLTLRVYDEIPKFNFIPRSHWDLGVALEILDFDRSAKISGSRFVVYKGLGAKLERSIINFMLDTHTKNGYQEILPPFIVNSSSMFGTGQLPKFESDAFKLSDSDHYLIPTAEVPLTNLHRDEILNGTELTKNYCAYSACFRKEAGAAGRDTKGLVRQHQFNKVELVKFSRPENSYQELEKLTNDAESILKLLKLPYRVVKLCAGDLGFCSAMTYDIEVWMPSYNRYVEISSCSNFESFQAQRANIRFKDKTNDKTRFVHTLNGSGLAIGRTFASILENFQTDNGKIKVPDVLQNYMGCQFIG